MCVEIKRLFKITKGGESSIAFMRDNLAKLITPDMEVYKLLHRDVFG